MVFILFQGLVFIPLTIGIHKQSRIAAILALGWYGLVQLIEVYGTGKIPSFIALMLILMLINGARGAIAVNRFPEPPDIDPADRVRSANDR